MNYKTHVTQEACKLVQWGCLYIRDHGDGLHLDSYKSGKDEFQTMLLRVAGEKVIKREVMISLGN